MLDNLQLLFVYAPVMNVQMILDGIFIGAVFALAAYGLALVWGVISHQPPPLPGATNPLNNTPNVPKQCT